MVTSMARQLALKLDLVRPALRLRRALGLQEPRDGYRIPLLVRERDAAIAELERHGVATGYLYDPPYDDYAEPFTQPSADPAAARWWARHVLPVDPLYASRALPVLRRLEPAWERVR